MASTFTAACGGTSADVSSMNSDPGKALLSFQQAMLAAEKKRAQQIPEGYLSAEQIAQKLGEHASGIRQKIRRWERDGMQLDSITVTVGKAVTRYYKYE